MAVNDIEMALMTLEEFYKIDECNIQRDTIQHALAASQRRGGHLREASPTQANVSIARWGKNKSCLLDGHSRRYLWKEGLLEKPAKLFVNIYNVKDQAEADILYATFDNIGAVEKATDRLYGSFRSYGFSPRTSLFKNSGTVSAMKQLAFPNKYADIKMLTGPELVAPWIDTFKVIDESYETIRDAMIIPSWVMTAVMLTVRRDGPYAMSFWEAYNNNAGRKSEKSVDGIFAASYLYDWVKTSYIGRSGTHRISACTPLLLWYYEEWRNNRRIPIKYVGTRVRYGPKFESPELDSLTKWWKEHLGDYDHPQLRSQKDMLAEDK